MRITVVYSLPTRRAIASPYKATDEDTKDSAEQVAAALKTNNAQVTLVPISENTLDAIDAIRTDLIFNLIEWDGLDTALSLAAFAKIESLGISFTGPGLSLLTAFSDKVKMKEALDVAGLATPRWQLFTTGREPVRQDFTYPLIVKLAWEHCSVGLTKDAIVESESDLTGCVAERLRVFHQPVYAEEFIIGREFQVTVYSGKGGVVVLPPAEITFKQTGTDAFLTFASRWDEEHPEYCLSGVALAKLSDRLDRALVTLARQTFTKLGFCDYGRLDIRTRGETPYILEANINPGLSDDDEYGMTVSYRAAGMTFADFVWEIVRSCIRRFSITR
ncbi:hypothetical protein HY950_02535 [Candidatus Gottesmanbacteria bacterium]|nr:hypothetical protein [Candidatus Gottesmanbacteria bacterium]